MKQTLYPLTSKYFAPPDSPLHQKAQVLVDDLENEINIKIGVVRTKTSGPHYTSKIQIWALNRDAKTLVCKFQSKAFLSARTEYSVAGIELNRAIRMLPALITRQKTLVISRMLMTSTHKVESSELI